MVPGAASMSVLSSELKEMRVRSVRMRTQEAESFLSKSPSCFWAAKIA